MARSRSRGSARGAEAARRSLHPRTREFDLFELFSTAGTAPDDKLSAMLELAAILDHCGTPPLLASADARKAIGPPGERARGARERRPGQRRPA